jgi:threonine dehydrogenase-like Zn-dependent dehydrogenase
LHHLSVIQPYHFISSTVESEYSLISSGTELKVFKGDFENATLDLSIDGMKNECMAYPLSYGYCLVGRIVKCGSHVSSEEFLGRLAFTFAAHATHVVTAVDALQLVPHGISARDAIFMPSVETAISLVHDAHVRVGENVAVYGQGLIGLLVTAILHLNHYHSSFSGKYGSITTFDTIPDRLAASSRMGATQALLPSGTAGTFDVAIEVSGNARALQSAMDSTSDGGRIIVGSWYGYGDVSLKLGIDFHRSHKTIRTSQVSDIPAAVSGLWDKKRRFGLAWALVRDLQPSRLLTKTTTLGKAMDAYRALDQGTELAVAFDYGKQRKFSSC